MFSFILTGIAIIPFIDILYRLKFIRKDEQGVVGGGVLIVALVSVLFILIFPLVRRMGVYISSSFPIKLELNIIFFTFISFGLLGLYDDIMKIFGFKKTGFFGLRVRHKLVVQAVLAAVTAILLYFNLHIEILNVPYLGVLHLGWMYIPLATFIIMSFANALDMTDGMDGLSCGVLLVCLLAFWGLSVTAMDTPLSIFVALWIGSLIAFLYFNVYPARIWLGNAGGLAFGATLAVVGLLLGKVIALVVIGGLFIVELVSSLVLATPLHNWLQVVGWSKAKIMMRAWLAAVILAVFGIWLAQL